MFMEDGACGQSIEPIFMEESIFMEGGCVTCTLQIFQCSHVLSFIVHMGLSYLIITSKIFTKLWCA